MLTLLFLLMIFLSVFDVYFATSKAISIGLIAVQITEI